jgi:nucleotide-binding universal stress UspA family protein
LGSVSESLAESVAAPTLVVRSAAPFEAWTRGERSLKVLVASDFTSVSEAAIHWAGDLRRLGPCSIVVAQLDRPQEECKRLGFSRRMSFHENPAEVQRLLERDLQEKVRVWLGGENVRVVVEPVVDRPDVRLIELAAEVQADLIVVGTHQRRRLGRVGRVSVSRGILRHAPVSVACVPAATFAQEGERVPEIQRVLVATDFSELGNRAVPHAYSLLREGGTVFLLHVAHPMPWPNPLSRDLDSKMDRAEKDDGARLREAFARLLALIPTEAEKRDVASEAVVTEHRERKGLAHVGMYDGIVGEAHVIEDTDPAKAICQAAERFGADVICLSSHGRSGFSAALMGSVAQAVMAQSHRPVLVVRPPVA